MEILEPILRLTSLGRFGDALRALENAKPSVRSQARADVLRADLLERVGQSPQALALATTLLRSRRLTDSDRSDCQIVSGRVLFDEGDTEGGLAHFQRAALNAEQAGNLRSLFRAKLQLLAVVSDRSGPAAASSILADVRQIATKLGDPETTARLHMSVAQSEAKRGLLENAKRHIAITRSILRTSPNAYFEAYIGNLELAIAVLRSEFDFAKRCGTRAIELAEQSGVARMRAAILGNMGNMLLEIGEFDHAREHLENALIIAPTHGPQTIATLESLARVHLFKGRTDLCVAKLDQVESSIRGEQDRLLYEHRYSALTRIHVLTRQYR
jgi:tetratricopeptide (TPR) repeat protein